MFKDVLLKQNCFACTVGSMRSFKHTVYNVKTAKAALHAFDSKQYILDNEISTLPFGHFSKICIELVLLDTILQCIM